MAGPTRRAGCRCRARLLDDLERDTDRALDEGYSANLVVHAFARTARAAGFGAELTRPFFASMRMDLTETAHDEESFRRYCKRLGGGRRADVPADLRQPAPGATGARLQRRRTRDSRIRGPRTGLRFPEGELPARPRRGFRDARAQLLPGIDPATLTDAQKDAVLDGIDAELVQAGAAIPLLPRSSRRAVAVAHGLFAELSRRIRATPASELLRTRVRVPDPSNSASR
jgi:hypothetical protein